MAHLDCNYWKASASYRLMSNLYNSNLYRLYSFVVILSYYIDLGKIKIWNGVVVFSCIVYTLFLNV